MGHEERFAPPRLSARCGFRKETIAGVRHNGRDAPEADRIARPKSTLSRKSAKVSFARHWNAEDYHARERRTPPYRGDNDRRIARHLCKRSVDGGVGMPTSPRSDRRL